MRRQQDPVSLLNKSVNLFSYLRGFPCGWCRPGHGGGRKKAVQEPFPCPAPAPQRVFVKGRSEAHEGETNKRNERTSQHDMRETLRGRAFFFLISCWHILHVGISFVGTFGASLTLSAPSATSAYIVCHPGDSLDFRQNSSFFLSFS